MNLNEGETAPELRYFTTLESSLYPELSAHHEHVFDEWEKKHAKARRRSPVPPV